MLETNPTNANINNYVAIGVCTNFSYGIIIEHYKCRKLFISILVENRQKQVRISQTKLSIIVGVHLRGKKFQLHPLQFNLVKIRMCRKIFLNLYSMSFS